MQDDRTVLPTASIPITTGNIPDGSLFYTLKEAAALLQISEVTYYREVRAGRLPGRKIAGRWRVSKLALHRYADGEVGA